MYAAAQDQGVSAALEAFGFSKEARDMAWFKKLLARKAATKVAFSLGDAGQWAKRMMIGDPKQFFSQLSKGELHKPGGMWRESLKPQGPLDALMLYGFPAFSMYQAVKAPPDQRGSAIGGTLGSMVGGMAGMPLGVVGNTIGSNLAGRLGQTLGRTFDTPVQRPRYLNHPGSSTPRPTEPVLSEQMSAVSGRPTKL